MIDYDRLMNWDFGEIRQEYTDKDAILYALALGIGADPLLEDNLRFTYENSGSGLQILPTMAVTLGTPQNWAGNADTGINWLGVVHGEQELVIHAPFPSQATIIARSRVTHVIDKGLGRGALVRTERVITDEVTGKALATAGSSLFCRHDGGFSNGSRMHNSSRPAPAAPPMRPPDHSVDIATRSDAALLYRLCGDRNPLHADPMIATKAGFPAPILHGLATYGIAFRAVMDQCCDGNPGRLHFFNARFSSVVFPGETLRFQIWQDDAAIFFRGIVPSREATVLTGGYAKLRSQ